MATTTRRSFFTSRDFCSILWFFGYKCFKNSTKVKFLIIALEHSKVWFPEHKSSIFQYSMTLNPNVNKQNELDFSTQETAIDNTWNNRGRSSSRKRQLPSTSADLMKPPQSRQRLLSVTRQSVKSSGPSSNPVTFKTQGESFNMSILY